MKNSLSQVQTKVSRRKKIDYLIQSMETKIDINRKDVIKIKRSLRRAVKKLRQIQQEAAGLCNQHLSTRALTMNVASNSSSEKQY